MNRFLTRAFLTFFAVVLPLLPCAASTNFEELDKPPDGAYKGQLIVGGFFSLGVPTGSMIDAENNFIKGSTYTFTKNETTKEVWISHLSYMIGAFCEYMPIDYVGLHAKLYYSAIVQRTNFGSDYENTRKTLYQDVSFLFGPTIHATNRRPWDLSFTPLVGVSYGTYHAAPIAAKMITGFSPSSRSGSADPLAYGADLTASVYFSGGLYLALTGEWVRNTISLKAPVDQTNPQTGASYMNGGTKGTIDSWRFIISSGYAFSN